jgi:hypothetical protein
VVHAAVIPDDKRTGLIKEHIPVKNSMGDVDGEALLPGDPPGRNMVLARDFPFDRQSGVCAVKYQVSAWV